MKNSSNRKRPCSAHRCQRSFFPSNTPTLKVRKPTTDSRNTECLFARNPSNPTTDTVTAGPATASGHPLGVEAAFRWTSGDRRSDIKKAPFDFVLRETETTDAGSVHNDSAGGTSDFAASPPSNPDLPSHDSTSRQIGNVRRDQMSMRLRSSRLRS